MSQDRLIICPSCQKEHHWQTSKPWSPFCSERCKLLDLGAWASEQHRIPGEDVVPIESEQENH